MAPIWRRKGIDMPEQTVHLAVYDTLADWETGYAVAYLNKQDWQRRPGRYRVVTVGETTAPVTTMGGVRITPDVAVADVTPNGSAMLILPGADTWDAGGNGAFSELAGRFLDARVPVAAICGATFGLARQGLLNDRAHTSNAVEYLTQTPAYTGTARYRDERTVTDRGLITAGATAPLDFARAIFAELDAYSPGMLEAWYGLHATGEARWFGAIMAAFEADQAAAGTA
jgi:putative intracellular protease/amidase